MFGLVTKKDLNSILDSLIALQTSYNGDYSKLKKSVDNLYSKLSEVSDLQLDRETFEDLATKKEINEAFNDMYDCISDVSKNYDILREDINDIKVKLENAIENLSVLELREEQSDKKFVSLEYFNARIEQLEKENEEFKSRILESVKYNTALIDNSLNTPKINSKFTIFSKSKG